MADDNNNNDGEFDFDDIPDEFADIEGVDWAQLLAGHGHPTTDSGSRDDNDAILGNSSPGNRRRLVPPPGGGPGNSVVADAAITISSSTLTLASDADITGTGRHDGDGDTSISSNYFGEDDMDSAFFAELDQVEQSAIIRASQTPTNVAAGHASNSNWSLNTTVDVVGLPRVSAFASTSNHGASCECESPCMCMCDLD